MDALSELVKLGESVPLGMRNACAAVLEDPRFAAAIASQSHHPLTHQVPGGLVVHTLEVAKHAMGLATDESMRNRAYVAAVFHDYGKIYEYAIENGETVKLPFAKMFGHIAWSWAVFVQCSHVAALEDRDRVEIGHAILAHHGKREYGSPVTPQTELARIVCTADGLSARGKL